MVAPERKTRKFDRAESLFKFKVFFVHIKILIFLFSFLFIIS